MHKEISPEEKLLSIIKGKKNGAAAENNVPKEVDKADKPEISRVGSIVDNYASRILKSDFFKNNLFSPKILKVFNKYMTIILVVAIIYFICDIVFVRPSHKAKEAISGFSASVTSSSSAKKTIQAEANTYSYYSNRISGKKIFGAAPYAAGEGLEGAGAGGEDITANLGLVGIIPGANPQAIIEDKKSQKTYYLMKGESTNGIVVEDVGSDKVTIEYKGKRLNLFL